MNVLGLDGFFNGYKMVGFDSISEINLFSQDLKCEKIDKEAGILIREKIQENLYKIYLTCVKVLNKAISFSHFRELMHVASIKGVWDYKGLTLNYVPFILLTFSDQLSNYFPNNKGFIKYKIVFQPDITAYDQLWNTPYLEKNILKVNKNNGEILEIIPIPQDPFKDIEPEYFSRIKVK
ncbi:hypothetical protein [Acinetobacter sp. A47]|uniref:hypothetical protein n=1 Tax=Acinetobacter sp. A47 TaxID=1561217 RepID=UPI0005713CFC|nr:hypothetical protein [Acinetobacter sp. A47]